MHADILLKCRTFFNVEVSCEAHKSLNSCRGVIRCSDLAGMSETDIVNELKDQLVGNVRRITVVREGKRSPTNTFIVTFTTPILPSSLRVGYRNVRVEIYIPNPMQCYKCFKYGHHESRCTRQPVCRKCGTVHDDTNICGEAVQCLNCKGNHYATSRNCPVWMTEKEVLRLKYTQSLSFPEARKLVTSNNSSSQSNTYTSVAKPEPQTKDCGIRVNLCCNSQQTTASQTSEEPNEPLTSRPVTNSTKKQTKERTSVSPSSSKGRTSVSPSSKEKTSASSPPERMIQKSSPKKKIVLTDRVKKALRDPVFSQNPYAVLSENEMMENEDMNLSQSPPSSRSMSPIKYP